MWGSASELRSKPRLQKRSSFSRRVLPSFAPALYSLDTEELDVIVLNWMRVANEHSDGAWRMLPLVLIQMIHRYYTPTFDWSHSRVGLMGDNGEDSIRISTDKRSVTFGYMKEFGCAICNPPICGGQLLSARFRFDEIDAVKATFNVGFKSPPLLSSCMYLDCYIRHNGIVYVRNESDTLQAIRRVGGGPFESGNTLTVALDLHSNSVSFWHNNYEPVTCTWKPPRLPVYVVVSSSNVLMDFAISLV